MGYNAGHPPALRPMRIGCAVALFLASAVILVATFVPWARGFSASGETTATGFEVGFDGFLSLLIGLVVLFGAIMALVPGIRRVWILGILGLAGGLASGVVALVTYLDIQDRRTDSEALARTFGVIQGVEMGPGIWMLVVGAVIAVVGGIFLAFSEW